MWSLDNNMISYYDIASQYIGYPEINDEWQKIPIHIKK